MKYKLTVTVFHIVWFMEEKGFVNDTWSFVYDRIQVVVKSHTHFAPNNVVKTWDPGNCAISVWVRPIVNRRSIITAKFFWCYDGGPLPKPDEGFKYQVWQEIVSRVRSYYANRRSSN